MKANRSFFRYTPARRARTPRCSIYIRFFHPHTQDEIDDDSEYDSETTEDEYPPTYFDIEGYEDEDADDEDDNDYVAEDDVDFDEIRRE